MIGGQCKTFKTDGRASALSNGTDCGMAREYLPSPIPSNVFFFSFVAFFVYLPERKGYNFASGGIRRREHSKEEWLGFAAATACLRFASLLRRSSTADKNASRIAAK